MGAGATLPRVDAGAVSARLRALTVRAEDAARTLDFERASELYDAAYVLGTAAGAVELAAESLAGLAYLAHLCSDVERAESLYTQALDATMDPERRSVIHARLGFAHYDRGALAEAGRVLAVVVADAPTISLRARATGFLGNIARARGERPRALSLYDEASRLLTDAGDERFAATFAMDRAITELLAGDPRTALVELEELARREVVAADPQLEMLVSHYRALARADLGLPILDATPARSPIASYLSRARRFANPAERGELVELEETAPPNAHARVTLQLLERLRRRGDAQIDVRSLVVSRSGSFFRLGAKLVPLAQRMPLARLLMALVHARLTSPGGPIDGERLVEIAWPGERVLPAARKNRLHVAIATLRKLGLRPVLESCAGGYRIDRDVTVLIVD